MASAGNLPLERRLNDLPVLDPQPLRDLLVMGASSALVQELITLFQEDVPNHMAILKTALAALDAPQIMMEAHQLKGALGNLGLVRFASLASRIEAFVQEGHLEEVPPLAEALPAAYEEALQALTAAFPRS
jgi:HPt (histidine-containing phosphotransfer) domain-containing protein